MTDLQILSKLETVQPNLISCLFDELITKPGLDLREKATALKIALNRLHAARLAHVTARKIHQNAKVWRSDADLEDHHWQQKTREALDDSVCAVKAAEAELRRIRLIKLTN